MNRLVNFSLAVVCLVFAALASAQTVTIDWTLDDAIRQIDRQADNFASAMARVEFAVKDASGTVTEQHAGVGFIRENGDMHYSQDGGNRVVIVDGNDVSDFDRAAATVTLYSMSRDKSRLERFYRLGFSLSGRDMRDNYLVTLLGEEQIGEARTLVLELTPERDSDRETISKIRLWIDQASWMPRRQEFSSTTSRSTTTLDFTGMARNLRLNPDLFRDNWPRGTQEIRGDRN